MKEEVTRDMFIKWIKATSWHPCGLQYLLNRNYLSQFDEPVESMYNAYAAGIRKGIRIQKEKQKVL